MRNLWISVEDRLPKMDEIGRFGHIADEDIVVDREFPRSKTVCVAEKKGDYFEEDTGHLLNCGWASDCDNVTHWKPIDA